MRFRPLFLALPLALSLLACGESGDGGDATDDTKGSVTVLGGGASSVTYSVCAATWSKVDFLKMMNGNLVFVADASSHGKSSAEAIGELVGMLVLNGIDPVKLADYDVGFADGDYTYKAGDEGYTFSLYFVSDFGAYKAGDKIPYNVFDYESYVTNVHVTLLPTPSVTYDHGPLWDFVDGSVSVSGTSVKFALKSDQIAFALNSKSTYYGQSPRESDTLLWSMTTTPAALDTIKEQFEAGGYGLLFDGTVYDSKYYDVKQTFGSSPALMKHDDQGYFWELTYQSTVEKAGISLYQTGLASERQANTTSYYCDAEHQSRIGIATHATDLKSGSFVFDDGTTVSYGLEDF